MCMGICCWVGKHGDEIKIWFGDPAEPGEDRDSHEKIAEFHGLPEIKADYWRRTPLEHYFHDTVEPAEKMERHFDEGKPTWWDEDCDAAVNSALQTELNLREKMARTGGYPGYPKFVGKNVVVPWTEIGYLDARAATSIALPAATEIGNLTRLGFVIHNNQIVTGGRRAVHAEYFNSASFTNATSPSARPRST